MSGRLLHPSLVGGQACFAFPLPSPTPPSSYLPPDSTVKGEGYVCATCQESSCQHAERQREVQGASMAHSSAVYLFVLCLSGGGAPVAGPEDQRLPGWAGRYFDSQGAKNEQVWAGRAPSLLRYHLPALSHLASARNNASVE